MRYELKATDADGAKVVKTVEAASGFDAVNQAMREGLSGVVAHPIRDQFAAGCPNTRAADAHAARLEMQSTPYWGQA